MKTEENRINRGEYVMSGTVNTLVIVAVLSLLSINTAVAACDKYDRSDCDLVQSCAQNVLDACENVNKVNPFPTVRKDVQRIIDETRKEVSSSGTSSTQGGNATSAK